MRNHFIAAFAALILAILAIAPANAGSRCHLSPECRAAYEAEIAYWKGRAIHDAAPVTPVKKRKKRQVSPPETTTVATGPKVNTCVTVTQREPGFLSAFAYNSSGRIIWQTHWMAGKSTSVCIPKGIFYDVKKFWVCKKKSSRYPNGRGKRLERGDMADWHREGRPLGVMNIKD